MEKRGQVTVYIILGIVIFVVFAFVLTMQTGILKSEFEMELERAVVPTQFQPIKNYMDSCLENTIMSAIYTLSANGGYLNLPEDILPRSITNPFSNSLELYPGSEVAYWFYETANGIQVGEIPSLGDMELELQEYLNSEFSNCLFGLQTYVNEGFEIETPSYTYSNVNIETNYIEIIVESPMDVSINGVGKLMKKHLVKLELPLGKFYNLANEILNEESQNNFLEEKTLDAMDVYEEIPFSGLDFDCGGKTWSKGQVETNFKEIMERNIGSLRLRGSQNTNIGDIYNYYSVDVRTSEDVASNFIYSPNWPLYFDVIPSQGDFMSGSAISQSVPGLSKFLNVFFCLNDYHFVYDIKYPVLVSLSDSSGYTFQFANMVVIDNNQAKRSKFEILNFDNSVEMRENICNVPSKEISVGVFDYTGNYPLPGSTISYKCSIITCYLGKTDIYGIFTGNSPACLNGQLIIEKEGYHQEIQEFSTNTQDQATISLSSYQELDVEFKIIDFSTGEVRDLSFDENVNFQFEGLNNNYMTVVSEDSEKITLIPGLYKITSYLTGEPGFDVSGEGYSFTECVSVPKQGILGFLFNEEKCFDVEFDEFELNEVIIGGFELNNFYIDSLSTFDKITLYGVLSENPTDVTDLTRIFEDISTNYLNNNFREPELS